MARNIHEKRRNNVVLKPTEMLMVQKVFETVLRVSSEGVTILLIEQNAKLALEVSNRGYVMESGEITLSGEAKTLLHDPAVRAAYLGEGA